MPHMIKQISGLASHNQNATKSELKSIQMLFLINFWKMDQSGSLQRFFSQQGYS